MEIHDLLYGHFGPQHWWPARTRLEVVVGVVLTQNTAWSNVEKAIANLKNNKILNFKDLRSVPDAVLAECIRPAGYYNIKTRRLKNVLEFIRQRYGGSLAKMAAAPPDRLREELLAVNGLGPESVDSILLYAAGHPFFVVDAYTKRIFSRLGITRDTDSYNAVQNVFTLNLPRSATLFNEYHALIVMTGKHFCRPRPRCTGCPLRFRCKKQGVPAVPER